ncbi:type-F conjugative transfer system pilin acetylase TraX [Escherichia coli]|nr:type-F conjugative transfer system pilin acetylase TraX [Escherichia coli]
MPVTKCEPETTRKASRKYAKTQETVLSALLAQTEEVSVPLASLIKSPLNVRTVPYSAESVSELADSIKGVGLLQNLVVHALPGDRYGVAAGGRRLAALNMLAERNILPADWPVRVKVIPQELATAASMTENGQRRDMHPAEQIAGFRAMAQEGKTPAQIGDLLGYSPRHVQRMLKLADLAPVILDALAEDRITTEHCQALALENDTARQVQVFEAACQSGWGGKPEVQTIRRLVTESEVAVAGNSKFRFVGADAFSPDELRTDLFSDDEGGYVDCVALDAALLEKLQAVAEFLREAEGWEWCAGRMEPVGECREDAGTYRCLPEPEAVLTEAEPAINRLWGWGIIAQFAYYLAGFPWYEGNILFAFAVAAQVLTWCETRSGWRTAAAILLMALWGPLSGTSYGIAGLLMLAVSHRLYRAEDRAERLALVACLLAVIPALNLATSDAAAVAGLVMTVLTVGLVSCAGKSLPRFWPGDFFPVFYACHLAVLGVLAL